MPNIRPPAGRAMMVSVDSLRFDTDNPRLASNDGSLPSQEDILRFLWDESAVDEIALSISENGFYEHEPLLVIKEPRTSDFIVLEGNRRLAAVRLLREASLREELRATSLPKVSAKAAKQLDTLPVLLFPDRKGLWSYLGFRHVNGTKPWDALSKAEFVAQVHEHYGVPISDIALRIGDQHSTVARYYRGYAVLKQAESQLNFDRSDLWRQRFYFSHLYTAVDQPEFKKFLGLNDDISKKNPVPRKKLPALKEFMTWLYGRRSESIEPVVRTQYPDLNNLRQVISVPHSLSLLRQGATLEHAYTISQGDGVRFRDAVVLAKDSLQTAKGTLATGYKGEEDLLSTMESVVITANSILEEMKRKPTKASRKR